VFDNTVYNCGGTGEQGIELGAERGAPLTNINVYNNYVHDCDMNGILLSSYVASGCTAQLVSNITIRNNRVENNGAVGAGGIGVVRTNVQNIKVENNIVSNNNKFQIAYTTAAPAGQITFSGNIITGYRGYSSGDIVELKDSTVIYYVAVTGNDSNDGKTLATAWKTIKYAATKLVAGDTLYIKAGTYNEYVINPLNSGTADKYITYQPYPGDEAAYNATTGVYSGVWIDATGLVAAAGNWSAIMHIGRSGARSYIKVSGLGFRNALGTDRWIMGICSSDSSNIILQKNYCRNITSAGICVSGGTHNVVDGNTSELCQRGITPPYNGYGGRADHENLTVYGSPYCQIINNRIFNSPGVLGRLGICVKDGANYTKISYNEVYDIENDGGILVTATSSAGSMGLHDIEIDHNDIHHLHGTGPAYGITISTEGGFLVENFNIHDNKTHDNEDIGICISSWLDAGAVDQGVHHVQIYNNIIYANDK
jgi:hypothetical protein